MNRQKISNYIHKSKLILQYIMFLAILMAVPSFAVLLALTGETVQVVDNPEELNIIYDIMITVFTWSTLFYLFGFTVWSVLFCCDEYFLKSLNDNKH